MYEYLAKAEAQAEKKRIIEVIHLVQKDLKGEFTFQYEVIGSASRNMITRDRRRNKGYDFDINLVLQKGFEEDSPERIKKTLMNSFNKFAKKYGYDHCEDSTRVFTIKVKDVQNS